MVVVDRESAAVTDAARKRTEFVTEEDIDDLESRWGLGGGDDKCVLAELCISTAVGARHGVGQDIDDL